MSAYALMYLQTSDVTNIRIRIRFLTFEILNANMNVRNINKIFNYKKLIEFN